MDSLQSADCHLRVDLCCLDVRVTEHLLDAPDVCSIFVHQRGHRVPEQMARAALAQLCARDVPSRNPRQVIAAQRPSVAAQEYGIGG